MEAEVPWNGGWAKDGEAEEPARVAGGSAAGREGARRSEKAKVSEEALLTRSSKALTNLLTPECIPTRNHKHQAHGYAAPADKYTEV